MIEDQQFQIEQCGVTYSINEDDKTANVIGYKSEINKIFIPRSINYKSNEYIVTEISESAFEGSEIESVELAADSEIQIINDYAFTNCGNLKSVKIPDNSKIRIIGKNAFFATSIESFTIPEHLICISQYTFSNCLMLQKVEIPINCELQEIECYAFEHAPIKSLTIPSNLEILEKEWNDSIFYLESIIVSPNNPYFCLLNGQMLVEKSSLDEENYDVLTLCVRNIKKLIIPSFIKVIGSCALADCNQLQTVEFAENSELQLIDCLAFSNSSIDFLKMPPHVQAIGFGAFELCRKLRGIEIPSNSELKIVCSKVFSNSSIEYFTIPSGLIRLESGWCSGMKNLIKIDVSPDNPVYKVFGDKLVIKKSLLRKDDYNTLVFCLRNVRIITIPSFIEFIDSYAFDNCTQLQKVNIPQDSKLLKISMNSFNNTLIETIKIPKYLLVIDKYAFYECGKLRKVEIAANSELEIINERAFLCSLLQSFSIPSHLKQICSGAFAFCIKLQIVEFDDFSEIESIGKNAFFGCNQLIITVSVNVKDQFMSSFEDEKTNE